MKSKEEEMNRQITETQEQLDAQRNTIVVSQAMDKIKTFLCSYQNTEIERDKTDKILKDIIDKICKEYNIEIEGKNVVIVGRSNIVGKPLSGMFTNNNAYSLRVDQKDECFINQDTKTKQMYSDYWTKVLSK